MPASPAPPTGRAAQTADRHRRLLGSAVELAAEGGYEAVQMRDVAARAGVALGTLYRHFASKDHLLVCALAEQATRLQGRLGQRPAQGASPAERVAAALTQACRSLERRPSLTAAMITAMSSGEPEVTEAKREVHDLFVAIVAEAADGVVAPDLDAVSRILGHVWFAALSFWVGGLSTTAQMVADLELAARMLLDGR